MDIWGMIALLAGIAFLYMLIRWPGAAMGYVYSIAAAGVVFWFALRPQVEEGENPQILGFLSMGIGALVGMAYAASIHQGSRGWRVVLNGLVLPVIMALVGAVLLYGIAGFMHLLHQPESVLMDSYRILAITFGLMAGPGVIIMVTKGSKPRRLRKMK